MEGGDKVYSYGHGKAKHIKMEAFTIPNLIGEGGAEKASMERTNG